MVTIASFSCSTSGFLFDRHCNGIRPCICSSNNGVNCIANQLSNVPDFITNNIHNHSTELFVDFSYNQYQLTTVPAYAFKSLSAVNATSIIINLQTNRISNIDIRAFSGVEHLVTELHLENNNFTHIPLAIKYLSSLHALKIEANPLVNLNEAVLANVGSTLTDFTFSAVRFASFPDELHYLTALIKMGIGGINVPMINSSIFDGFKNTLSYLGIGSANLESIPSAVCRLTSLQKLNYRHSAMLGKNSSAIFDECSHEMPTVTSISLASDNLTTLPKFATFPNLKYLDLFMNAILFIESNTFVGLTSLVHIDLNYNHLTRIPFAINKATNLHRLIVGHNQIGTIEDFDLSGLHNLTSVFLHSNPLVYISPFAFQHTPLLSSIYMDSTNLGHVPQALLGLTNLHNVGLKGNQLTCSCQAMGYLKSWNITSVNIDATCNSGKSIKTYLTSNLLNCP